MRIWLYDDDTGNLINGKNISKKQIKLILNNQRYGIYRVVSHIYTVEVEEETSKEYVELSLYVTTIPLEQYYAFDFFEHPVDLQ